MSDLFISVGDYVIVQEGQADQPKIVVWDDLTIAEYANTSPVVLISVFDAVVAQDPISLVRSHAIVVSDDVRVKEGQTDDLAVVALDDVTVAESVTGDLSLLRVSVFDTVSVVEDGTIALNPTGTIGTTLFDSVTVQDTASVYVTVYINASDDVLVIDGARNMDVSDAVTVSEDVTVKVAFLLVNVNESVTITESLDVSGLGRNAQVNDDVILSESVTVLLASLTPAVSEDVTLTESVTVSVSSIALSMDVAESVTVAEYIEPQTNPMQIIEFTEVIIDDVPSLLMSILYIDVAETVTVLEDVTLALSLVLLTVQDAVTVTERVALRIGTGSATKSDLPVMGAGR